MNCPCCHAPDGLHTNQCTRAFKQAYLKAAYDLEAKANALANEYALTQRQVAASVAHDIAKACREMQASSAA